MESAIHTEKKQVVEKHYEIPLRPAVFGWLSEKLRPKYERELATARRDGNFKNLKEFHESSRISRLMTSLMDQFPDPETLPENPKLSLSNEDMNFLNAEIPRSAFPADQKLRTEMMRELKDSFSKVKTDAKVADIRKRVKSFFRRGK